MLIRTLSDLTLDRFTLDKFTLDKMTLDKPPFVSSSIGGIDQYTKLMLHMNGANGSTSFIDSSLTPKAVTAYGNAQISTAQSKFSGASGLFDGTGDYLSLANSTDFNFGTGNFSVDFWIYPTAFSSATNYIFATRSGIDNQNWYMFRINDTSGKLGFYSISSNAEVTNITTTTAPTLNAWNHVEVSVTNGIAYIFISGVLGASGTSGNCPIGTNTFDIGVEKQSLSCYYQGYIKEFRVVKGVGGHTADFTPPTAEYTT